MTYLVLARKYRPQRFEELVGQEHVVQALVNALTQQRLHHAYLFTGTRGVGKTTISRLLAKSLNCAGADGQGGITASPCGVCPACRDIDAGRFVDYIELDAASNRGVEEISQLLDQSVYKPVVGRFKVYMIDEVHMLSNTAFNAMLKTLEEPPDYLKFVLATTDPQKVPLTVLSRCLQFNLRPMAVPDVAAHLAAVLQAEGVPAEAPALRLLARAARGSMRDGLSLTDQAIAFGAGTLTEAGVRQMLGAVDRGHVVAIVDALVAASGAAVVAQADALRGLGLSAAGTLEDLATLFQQVAVAQAAPGALDEHDPDAAEARRLALLLPADEVQLMYSMALHGRQELGLAPDEYAGLLMVLLRMLSFRPTGVPQSAPGVARAPAAPLLRPAAVASTAVPAMPLGVSEPLPKYAVGGAGGGAVKTQVAAPATKPAASESPSQRLRPKAAGSEPAEQMPEPPPWLDGPEHGEADSFDLIPDAATRTAQPLAPRTASPLPSHAPAAAQPADLALIKTPLGERWQALVAPLGLTALARELAWQAECIGFEDEGPAQVWRLRVERESLRQPALKDKLQAALEAAGQRPVRVEIEAGVAQDSPALRALADERARQQAAEQLAFDDPLTQALLGRFKTARVVPGSIRPLLLP